MQLPVADSAALRRHTLALLRRYRGGLAVSVVLHGLAALAGLAGPWLLGRLVDGVTAGSVTFSGIDRVVLVLTGAVVAQSVLTRFARRQAMVLGETVFAQLREEFVATVTRLPLSTV